MAFRLPMSCRDIQSIVEAWRTAPDDHVCEALDHPEMFSEEIFQVVQEEAARRALANNSTRLVQPRYDRGKSAIRIIRDFSAILRIIGAALVGSLAQLLTTLLPTDALSGAGLLSRSALLFTYFSSLVICCFPLRTFRVVISVSLVAAIFFSATGLIQAISETISFRHWTVGIVLFGGLLSTLLMWAINSIVLTVILVFRKRLWPSYPKGHCQKCGYDLRGNVSRKCPECGLEHALAATGNRTDVV